jgi:hypothetical protein
VPSASVNASAPVIGLNFACEKLIHVLPPDLVAVGDLVGKAGQDDIVNLIFCPPPEDALMVALTAKGYMTAAIGVPVEKRFFGAHHGDAYTARTRPFW